MRAVMRASAVVAVVVVVVVAASAHADPRPKLAVIHAFRGIDVVQTINAATHMHGGAPATIDHVSVSFQVRDGKAHVVVAKQLELLHGHCNDTKWSDRKALIVTGYQVFSWDAAAALSAAKDRATLPATSDVFQVRAAFDGVQEYQACDRFAFALVVDVDGTSARVELPLDIKREEPLREP